jgi:hypothetical protein
MLSLSPADSARYCNPKVRLAEILCGYRNPDTIAALLEASRWTDSFVLIDT